MRGPRLPIKLCCRFRSENGHHVWWEEGHDGAWGLDRAADGMQTALRKSGQLHNLWSAWKRTHRSTAFRWKCSVRKPRRSCRRRAMCRWYSDNRLKEFPTYDGITKHWMNLCFSNRLSHSIWISVFYISALVCLILEYTHPTMFLINIIFLYVYNAIN